MVLNCESRLKCSVNADGNELIKRREREKPADGDNSEDKSDDLSKFETYSSKNGQNV